MATINKQRLPKHIAIIMDGNGRWAKQQSKLRIFGHHWRRSQRHFEGAVIRCKIPTLPFSTENWVGLRSQ